MSHYNLEHPIAGVLLIAGGLASIYYAWKVPSEGKVMLNNIRLYLFGSVAIVIGILIIIKSLK